MERVERTPSAILGRSIEHIWRYTEIMKEYLEATVDPASHKMLIEARKVLAKLNRKAR
jgi:hypothetical protein